MISGVLLLRVAVRPARHRRGLPGPVVRGFLSVAVGVAAVHMSFAAGAVRSEAAAVGVIGAIVVAFVRNSFSWNLLQKALAGTMSTVGTIVWLILGAVAFVGIYNLIGGADFMRSLFTGLGLSPLAVVALMMLILVILGTFMEWIAIAFITVPVFAPVVVGKVVDGMDLAGE